MRTRGGAAVQEARSDGPSGHARQEITSTAGELEGRSSQGVPGGEHKERKQAGPSSRYLGVSLDTAKSAWDARLTDPQTKRRRCIGSVPCEEDAARAYDCAAMQARGPDAKRKFPGDIISELPATLGEQRKQRNSSRYIGVSCHKAKSAWDAQLTDPQTMRHRQIGCFATEEDAARAYDCAAVQAHGSGAKRNFPGEAISELPVTMGEKRKQRSSSRYIGVSWETVSSSWRVGLWDPQTKRQRHIGCFASEEDAARAYDCAAVQASGPGAQRNFPGEAISEAPETVGEQKQQRSSSCYIGVTWQKAHSSWRVQLTDPQTKRQRHIGRFASEEDAARAHDCAAVQAHGPGAKRNFPGEAISEAPVTVGEQRQQRNSSRFIGVRWDKRRSAWCVRQTDPQTKRSRYIGRFPSEEDAARAYDCAAVQAHGPGAKRNFPGEDISILPVSMGQLKKQHSSSRHIGVSWHKANSSWGVTLWDPQTKGNRQIGCFASEEDAARAYDRAAVQAHRPGAERNFPGEAVGDAA
ncbi:hypothetical protein FOA52_015795 [Chlamydomonas sp. UWO 241]|nr:hypothetical protein FOA52_015795 [Chlamydomonas sp. UWO 241]